MKRELRAVAALQITPAETWLKVYRRFNEKIISGRKYIFLRNIFHNVGVRSSLVLWIVISQNVIPRGFTKYIPDFGLKLDVGGKPSSKFPPG